MSESLEEYALTRKITKKDAIHKVGIVGCGQMGQEISRIISKFGMDVVFLEISEEKVQQTINSIISQLDDEVNHWGLTLNEKKIILNRITGTTDYNKLSDCDLVIEAVNSRTTTSDIQLTRDVFKRIESVVDDETIIATNNSTVMISEIAAVLKKPERVIGLHFMSPASLVKIVEVVKGIATSQKTYDIVCRFAKTIDRKVITITESPGHVSTRLIVTLINEACELLLEGVASIEAIDKIMKEGYGMQLGPFELADKIGLDKVVRWMDNLFEEYGLFKFKASPIIKKLVRAHYYGKKAGKGFYKYNENGQIIGIAITTTDIKLL